ncbi:hypothetical protein [Methylobacterium sp. GC_Met_2]|uniref:hypothetical protein n=1 Tax=Methylobacterium sp. GC_Met_2 TaxID=2937376 RepID=UPI00226B4237
MSDPANANPKSDEQRKFEGRRAALKTMGVVAAYTAPVLLATSIPTKAARASGSAGGGGGQPYRNPFADA